MVEHSKEGRVQIVEGHQKFLRNLILEKEESATPDNMKKQKNRNTLRHVAASTANLETSSTANFSGIVDRVELWRPATHRGENQRSMVEEFSALTPRSAIIDQ